MSNLVSTLPYNAFSNKPQWLPNEGYHANWMSNEDIRWLDSTWQVNALSCHSGDYCMMMRDNNCYLSYCFDGSSDTEETCCTNNTI